ncbi:MAG: hypothetical protein ACE5PV_06405 [Candidatus Poribacteria bacterium]
MCREKCHKGQNPKECTPEQIRECHGDVREHPCEEPGSKKQDSGK